MSQQPEYNGYTDKMIQASNIHRQSRSVSTGKKTGISAEKHNTDMIYPLRKNKAEGYKEP